MTMRGQRRPSVVPIAAPSFPTLPRPPIYRRIAYIFLSLTAIFVVVVLWLSSVRAEVVVKVKRSIVSLESGVEVARSPAPGQIIGRVVQGTYEKIQEFQVPQSGETPSAVPASDAATSTPPRTQDAGTSLAKGTVTVINNYSKAQTLVKTTRLLTSDNKLFRIDQTIVVPAGGKQTVGAYADKTGEAFAIRPTRFTIPGLFIDLQKHIYAESTTPFTLSSVAAVPSLPQKITAPVVVNSRVVTASVLENAYKTLTDNVVEQAKRSLQAEAADDRFADATYLVKIIEKKSNATVGQSAESFLASVKLDVTAVFYPKEDMQALIRSKLKEKIPDGREFLPFHDQSVTYAIEQADTKAEQATIRVHAQGQYRLTSASPILQKGLVAGKTADEARELLLSFGSDVEDVQVKMYPGWLRKIPTMKDRIELTVE